MVLASLLDEIARVQWLILGSFAFLIAWYLRRELKDALGRLSIVHFKRNETEVGAQLDRRHGGEFEEEPEKDPLDREERPVDSEDQADEPSPQDDDPASVRQIMMHHYIAGDVNEGDVNFNRLSSLESDPEERRRDTIRRFAARYMGGIDHDGEEALRNSLGDPEMAGFAHYMLGECMRHMGKVGEAAHEFDLGQLNALRPIDRVDAAVSRAECLTELGEIDEAAHGLGDLARDQDLKKDGQCQMRLWDGFAEIYGRAERKKLKAFALHQGAIMAGNSARRWFDAGYAYSSVGGDLGLLSLHCYRTALRLNTDERAAKNNLGVLFEGFELPITSIKSFSEAVDEGHTLAMANMARRFSTAGFESEATATLAKASENSDPHSNVSRVTADLDSMREKEKAALSCLEADASKVSEFFDDLVAARMNVGTLEGDWHINDAEVELTLNRDQVELTWQEKPPLAYRRFVGELAGAALEGSFEKEAQALGRSKTVWAVDGHGYGVLSEDGSAISFVKLAGGSVERLEFERASKNAT